MANEGQVRAGSLVKSQTSSGLGLKLPLLLTARPGNVGVPIDAHRMMNRIKHPRSDQFTSQFHGILFENGSLENYSRVVERTALRTRLLQDKLEKLQARENHLLEDENKRKQRRIQREAARQRRMWQIHQAAKRKEERERDNVAATTVQKVIRGALARRAARILRNIRAAHEAASLLQRAMKTHVCRQQLVRERERQSRQEEERRELELNSAAAVLQRQARKRLNAVQNARQTALAACTEDDEDEDEEVINTLPEQASLKGTLLADEKIIADALRRGISLDLLFSDEEDSESAYLTSSASSSIIVPVENKPPQPLRLLPQPPSNAVRPRRPMSIKRVGGGYRTKLLPHDSVNGLSSTESTTRTSRGSNWLQESRVSSSCDVNDIQRRPQRSSALLKSKLPSPSSTHTLRAPITSKKSDSELRAASPPKVSPYAIPLRRPK